MIKKRWTPDDDARLKQLVSDELNSTDIAKLMGKTVPAVKDRAKRLRLRFLSRKPMPEKSTSIRDDYWDQLNAVACDAHLADLQAAHPGGCAYVVEKPTIGGPRKFIPEPWGAYRSPAALLVEG